jgi:hypothetical protein
LKTALDDAHVPPKTADAIIKENATARIDGLRTALSVLSLFALIALFFAGRIPAEQPASAKEPPASHDRAARLGGSNVMVQRDHRQGSSLSRARSAFVASALQWVIGRPVEIGRRARLTGLWSAARAKRALRSSRRPSRDDSARGTYPLSQRLE